MGAQFQKHWERNLAGCGAQIYKVRERQELRKIDACGSRWRAEGSGGPSTYDHWLCRFELQRKVMAGESEFGNN